MFASEVKKGASPGRAIHLCISGKAKEPRTGNEFSSPEVCTDSHRVVRATSKCARALQPGWTKFISSFLSIQISKIRVHSALFGKVDNVLVSFRSSKD